MAEIRATGIVTRVVDYREYDRIVTILSPQIGTLQLCLRGCRKPAAKLRAAAQLFCFADFELLSRRAGHYIMTGCTVRDSFFALSSDVSRMRAAGTLCGIATGLFDAQEDARADLFAALLCAITTLAYAPRVHAQEIVLVGALRLLDAGGYRPQTQSCAECGAPIAAGPAAFDPARGGVLCPGCAASDPSHLTLCAGAVSSMRAAMDLPNEKMPTFHFSAPVRRELMTAVQAVLSCVLERHVSLQDDSAFHSDMG